MSTHSKNKTHRALAQVLQIEDGARWETEEIMVKKKGKMVPKTIAGTLVKATIYIPHDMRKKKMNIIMPFAGSNLWVFYR